jgi:choline monooxygenase
MSAGKLSIVSLAQRDTLAHNEKRAQENKDMASVATRESLVEEATDLLTRVDAGYTLPSHWYADSAVFSREQDVILRKGWHYGAHTDQLRRVGDQAVCEIAGVPVVLVVDKNEQIRGFVNICRHRAHIVTQQSQCRGTLQCQYHGWTYNLDGTLRAAPRAEAEDAFGAEELSLTPVQTAVWGPTVWVNIDAEAPPFFECFHGLAEAVAGNGVDVPQHRLAFERSWEIRTNWKVFLDNAIECYHCPTCHPSLSKILTMDPATQDISVNGRFWSTHRVPLRRSAEGTNVAAPTGPAGDGNYYFHWLFPCTYFQYAGGGFDVGTITARDVNHIVFHHMTFLRSDASSAEIASREERLDEDPTASEDIAICERVQTAHETGVAVPGRLLPRSEWLLLHFQRVVLEEIQRATWE